MLSTQNTETQADATVDQPANGRDAFYQLGSSAVPIAQTQPVEYVSPEPAGTTAPYIPSEPASYQVPVRPSSREFVARAPGEGAAAASSALLVPRGAVEMLNNESVVLQLGALYLTNKRVILLAPTVVRSAFLRDVDAIGTLTERASGWSFFFGLVLLAIAGAGLYFSIARAQYENSFPTLYIINPSIVAIVATILAVYLLVNYFFWVKRTLFLSVGGRPLITVSVTDWNAKKLEGMDAFINAYSQVKDGVIAEERQNP